MTEHSRSEMSVGIKTFFAKKPKPFIKPTSKKVVIPTNHIVGRFQSLKDLSHPNLCKYIDIVKGKHERLFIVSEHYTKDLLTDLQHRQSQGGIYEERELQQLAFTLLKSITYLNERNIIHRNINLDNILFDEKGEIRLADYGLYSMTEAGSLVPFPIGNPTYLAPESIARGIAFITPTTVSDSFKVDTWSLGVLLLHLVLGHVPWDLISVNMKNNSNKNPAYETLLKILKFCGHDIEIALELQKTGDLQQSDLELIKQKESAIGALIFNSVHKNDRAKWTFEERQSRYAELNRKRSQTLNEWLNKKPFTKFSDEFKEILTHCLIADPTERPEPQELLQHPYFSALLEADNKKRRSFWAIKPFLKCSLIPDDDNFDSLTPYQRSILFDNKDEQDKNEEKDKEPQSTESQGFSVEDLFHFWLLTGGDIESELLSPEYKIPPPVIRLPVFVQLRDETQSEATFMFQQPRDTSMLYWDKILSVSFAALRSKIEGSSKPKQVDSTNMSLTEREKSWIYQQNRVTKLRGLIARPRSWRQAIVEAEKDVPPVLRADIWALALGVTNPEEYKKKYEEIDKESEGIHDRQIDLDVPRCHQYNPALSSSAGHRKLKRILKAWVKYNPDYAYWQGVDSLLAPFVVLNFNDEARAFWCLQRVVDKFLHNVLLHKDEVNNSNLQERLVLFQQILAYHDPILANHLNDIGFKPELYAIPWFLTLFTHIFSLDEIFHIWDTLLLSPPSFSLFIACAIMRQLKDFLMPLDFNACIHLFSSLPAVNIEECLKDAKEIMNVTPPSVTTLNENSKPSKRWWEQRIPVDTLATQLAPRVAVTDLVGGQFKFAVLDIRGPEEIRSERVFWPDSLKFDLKKKQKSMPKLLQFLATFKDHIVVVDRGNNNTAAIQFANELVQANIARVSVLNGGIEALVTDAKPLLVIKN